MQARRARKQRFPFQRALRLRWAWAVAVALLAFLIGVAWLGGPRDAWAQLLRLIGYAPHVGFVNVEGARILPAVVTRQIGDVTVQVQVVRVDLILRTATGAQLRAQRSSARMDSDAGQAHFTLTFPPLPADVYQVDLDLSAVARALRLPAGEWQIPLTLHPADSAAVANVLVEPYEPDVPPQTRHGITLRVLCVAHTPEQTALQLEAEFPERYRTLLPRQYPIPLLYGDLGHVYYRPPKGGAQGVVQEEVSFVVPSAEWNLTVHPERLFGDLKQGGRSWPCESSSNTSYS
ncbi:MAG TPA: hypothetical protein EYP49_02855 [Anaerolineae bacterium]|nr:hypothetical protein [Anaerolineae bacterium]